MSINTLISEDGTEARICVCGKLDFSKRAEFEAAYRSYSKVKSYIIDLRETEGIDSSGLGLLASMYDYLKLETRKISIINSSSNIERTLMFSGFDKIFNLH